jgi:hypothetical protein
MAVLNRDYVHHGPKILFLAVSTLIHVLLLLGISMLLVPDFLQQTHLPAIEVTLTDNSRTASPTVVSGAISADRTYPSILKTDDMNRVNRDLLQLSAELIDRITTEIFAAHEDNFNPPAILPSIAKIKNYIDYVDYVGYSDADFGVTNVAFVYPDGSRLCTQYYEPDPLDSFDTGYWRINSSNCSSE